MVGSPITRKLREKGYSSLISRTMAQLDLADQSAVSRFFETEKPEYVILAAAKVGGILANNVYRAQFIYENLMIEANIIHQAYVHGVKKLLFLGSSCIYPKNAPQPLKEEYLLTGELEQTNEPYAIAKIAGIKLCESYYRQYGCNFISVMPTNLYGPNDNYDLETSHVLPAIIRKMHLAHCLETADWEGIRSDLNKRPIENVNGKSPEVEILAILEKYGIIVTRNASRVTLSLWGTGRVYREFMHVDDMAAACLKIMEEVNIGDLIARASSPGPEPSFPPAFLNVGTGEDQTIADIAGIVKSIVGFKGQVSWDPSKPDGTYKKLLDVGKLKSLGFNSSFSLEEGIKSVYSGYLENN
jgi:GDP-L-fucose synthase